MTIYEKPRSEVFASNAPESEISTFTAWLRGLGIAFDETNGLPEFSGLNNVFNLLNQYIKYLEQNGFAEWSPDLEYPIGAGVRVGAVWYRAKVQNTSKPPATSQNDWELFLNASALTYENPIYIQNNVVKVRGATQTRSGVVQFANATEVANKENVSKAINPSDVGKTFTKHSSKTTRMPNGLLIQTGVISVKDNSTYEITLEQSFSDASFVCMANLQNLINGEAYVFTVSSKPLSASKIQIKTEFSNDGFTTLANWIAIGY